MVSEKNWQTAWMRSEKNPLLFVTDVLGAIPEPWQAEALEAVGRHDRVSIRSGHGVGKTTLQVTVSTPGVIDIEDHVADVVVVQLQVS